MRYITLDKAKPGMKLAQDLFDSFGRTLISSKAELTDYFLQKLEEYGFCGIYIEDELSEGICIEPVISPQLRQEAMNSIRKCDIDRCMSIARRIVEDMSSLGTFTLELNDLRSMDGYTYAHSVNVAIISCVIGVGLGMSEKELEILVMAALMHDLGKLSIPPEILNKPGRLTPEEYEIMKSHATLSYQLISERFDISAHVKSAVLFHHENVDGSGYPQGLDGTQQSVYVKILHVADVFDALVSDRPYKTGYSSAEASEYMMGGCGVLFDLKAVESLLKYVPLYPKGTEVSLSDGRRGIVFDNVGFHNLRPILRLMDGTMLDLADAGNLSLAIVQGDDNTIKEHISSEMGRQKMTETVEKYEIMVVDDLKTNLQVIRGILEPTYKAKYFKSGKQAVSYIEKKNKPDLIIMDIDMPEMNGIETVEKIYSIIGESVPVLFVTSLCDKETVMACGKLHPAGYVVRPYKPVFIKGEIERILTGRRDFE
ncbi:MAG: HD domain-containing phosphohydrolase [Lachnospiraceae bacterium]